MYFFDIFSEYFLGKLSEDEKRGLKTPLCRTPVSDLLQFAAQFLPPNSTSTTPGGPYDPIPASLALTHGATFAITYSTANPESEAKSSSPANGGSTDEISGGMESSYPPMPAAAQHVSVVQERILKDSTSPENIVSTPEQTPASRGPDENRGKQPSGVSSLSSRRSRVVARFADNH